MPIPAFNNSPQPSPSTLILRYETEGMAQIRRILTDEEFISDAQVDTFKACLSMLQNKGFTLTRNG